MIVQLKKRHNFKGSLRIQLIIQSVCGDEAYMGVFVDFHWFSRTAHNFWKLDTDSLKKVMLVQIL